MPPYGYLLKNSLVSGHIIAFCCNNTAKEAGGGAILKRGAVWPAGWGSSGSGRVEEKNNLPLPSLPGSPWVLPTSHEVEMVAAATSPASSLHVGEAPCFVHRWRWWGERCCLASTICRCGWCEGAGVPEVAVAASGKGSARCLPSLFTMHRSGGDVSRLESLRQCQLKVVTSRKGLAH